MDIPVIYYVNVGFAWVIVALAIMGYFRTLQVQGEKWLFWPVFAGAFTMFGISHTLLVYGVSTSAVYLTPIRVVGYTLVVAALIALIARIKKAE
jgi:hypothetical protein